MKAYQAYKEAEIRWINNIPKHWDVKPLFAVMRENKETNTGNTEQNVLSLSYGRIIRRDLSNNFGLIPESFEGYQIVYPDYIVLRLTDLQNDWNSLRVGLVKEKGIITSAYVGLILSKQIAAKFAYYVLNAYDLLKVFYGEGSGVRQSMTYKDLRRMPIIFPTLPEQQAIADFLDRKTAQIDTLIAKKQRQIELLHEQRTALINHAVTKGLNPIAKMKDSGVEWLGEIPSHWEVMKLKRVIKGNLTYGANEPSAYADYDSPRYIRITDFDDNGTLRPDTFRSLPYELAKDYLLKDGDILFARSGATVGKTFQFKDYNGAACFAGYLIKADPDENIITSDFLYLYTKSQVYETWKNSIFIQATIQNIGANKYQMLDIPVPSIEEQKTIVSWIKQKVQKIDGLILKNNGLINLFQEYRTALISEAVTGKIDVRTVHE